MGVAFYIELDPEEPDVVTEVDGKLLAAAADVLNDIAAELGLKSLDDYFGASEEVLEDFDVDPEDAPDAGAWFPAHEGVDWFRQIAAVVERHPERVEDASELLEELRDFEQVLQDAETRGAQWHLALDI